MAKVIGTTITTPLKDDRVYAQKLNEIGKYEFEDGKWYPDRNGGTTNSTWRRNKEKIPIDSNCVYNIAIKPNIDTTTYIVFYDESGNHIGFKQFTENTPPPLLFHIENGQAQKVLETGATVTYQVAFINITTSGSEKDIMLWHSEEAEQVTEWLDYGQEPTFYCRENQVFSKTQTSSIEDMVDRATVDDDKARFDSSFNYIAYSSVTGSEGAINTAEHYTWAAKQGFTALKGDVRPTFDDELIMCHDAGFTVSVDNLSVDNSEGFLVNDEDGTRYNGTIYLTKYNAGTGECRKVIYDEEKKTYTLTPNTIDVTSAGSVVFDAYTDKGQQVYVITTRIYDDNGKYIGKEKTYYAHPNTFAIRKLSKAQCLALQHLGTTNHICDLDTFIRICKKYGKIAFITIRDEYIQDVVVPKMFDTLDKYSMRGQSIINSFTFDTLEKVKNADSRIMLSNVLGARKYLSTAYITNALELGVCLINCVDSAKENGFKIMGPGDSAEANEAREKELVTARAALTTAQASSIEAAQNASDITANLEDGDVKTAFQSILGAVQAVEDIDTAKFARTAANTALKLVNSGGSKSLMDAAQDAYDAAHQVVKAYGTIDAISNIPKTIALAKENNIRLYEAQVTSADDIEELMSYGIMGAQMGCVPNLPKEDIQLPKEVLQLPEVPITSQEITSDGKLKVIFDKNEFPDGLKRLKILAQVIAPAGTAGGKALYCEGIDEDGAIYNMVYRSGVGATSTEFTKFTCGIDFDWFETNPIEKKGAAISQFFVFAGDSQSQANTFALGTTDKKRPVAIQLYIKNVDAQEGSTIKVYGY